MIRTMACVRRTTILRFNLLCKFLKDGDAELSKRLSKLLCYTDKQTETPLHSKENLTYLLKYLSDDHLFLCLKKR